jgi:hypothetical protein
MFGLASMGTRLGSRGSCEAYGELCGLTMRGVALALVRLARSRAAASSSSDRIGARLDLLTAINPYAR